MTDSESVDVLQDKFDRLKTFVREYIELSKDLQQPRNIYSILKYRRSPNRKSRETSYQQTLRYFLDPNKPHGFGDVLLEKFLTLVQSKSLPINHIKVDTEVELKRNEEDYRPIDLVIADYDSSFVSHEAPNWALFIELKVAAREGEGQTEYYANADKWNPDWTDEWMGIEDIRTVEYLFVKKSSKNYDPFKEFSSISWEEIVELFTADRSALLTYPHRSVVQFMDFLNSLQEVEDMAGKETGKSQKKLVDLYLKRNDIIKEVGEAKEKLDSEMEEYVNDILFQGWKEKLLTELLQNMDIERVEETHKQYPEATSFGVHGNTWFLREGNSDYLQIFKENWIDRHSKQGNEGPVLYFFHRAKKNKILETDGGGIRFGLRIRRASTDKTVKNTFIEELTNKKRIQDLLKKKTESSKKLITKSGWNLTTNDRWKERINLDNDISNYYSNLAEILKEFLEEKPLIQELDEVLKKTVDKT